MGGGYYRGDSYALDWNEFITTWPNQVLALRWVEANAWIKRIVAGRRKGNRRVRPRRGITGRQPNTVFTKPDLPRVEIDGNVCGVAS